MFDLVFSKDWGNVLISNGKIIFLVRQTLMCFDIEPILLKINLKKFAVIWGKRRQKAGFFLGQISPKFTLTKEKERRKRKSEEEERRRRGKSNDCILSFLYNGYFGGRFWPFGGNVFKNPAAYILITKEDTWCFCSTYLLHFSRIQIRIKMRSQCFSNWSAGKSVFIGVSPRSEKLIALYIVHDDLS